MECFRSAALNRLYGGSGCYQTSQCINAKISNISDIQMLTCNLTNDQMTIFLNLRLDARQIFIDALMYYNYNAIALLSYTGMSEVEKLYYNYDFISRVLQHSDLEIALHRLMIIIPDTSCSIFFEQFFDVFLCFFNYQQSLKIAQLNFILFTQVRKAYNECYYLSRSHADRIYALSKTVNSYWSTQLRQSVFCVRETALELYIWTATKLVCSGFFEDLSELITSFHEVIDGNNYFTAVLENFADRAEFIFREPILTIVLNRDCFVDYVELYIKNGGSKSIFSNSDVLSNLEVLKPYEKDDIRRCYEEVYQEELLFDSDLF